MVERQIVILNVAGSSPVDHPLATGRTGDMPFVRSEPKAAKRFSSNLAKPNCEAFGDERLVAES